MSDEDVRAAAHDPGEVRPRQAAALPPAREADEAPPGELRVLPAVAGALLLALGLRRRGAAGTWSAAAGVGLLAHAVAPVMRDLVVRRGAARRAIDHASTFTVDRPIRDVFAFCANFEHFPTLVRGLERVDDYRDGRSHWTLRHPDGSLIEWDAIVTKFVPNQVIAWENVPGSPVESRGIVRVAALAERRTEVHVEVWFAPKRTSFDEAWHALLAPRPERAVDRQLSHATEVMERWDPTVEPEPPTPMTPNG